MTEANQGDPYGKSRSSEEAADVLIHIGYVKTGSTWLQRHVTDNPELGFREVADRNAIRTLLIHPNDLWYDPAPFREHVRPKLRTARAEGLIPVVTHERLSGNPTSGGYDAAAVAGRLAGQFPDGRVLIVIREQRSHLLSMYNEYVNGGGSCSLDRFLDPPTGSKIPLFDSRFLEFHRLILRYQELFGVDRVGVVPFELLKQDPDAFLYRVVEFSGARGSGSVALAQVVRRSTTPSAVHLQRRLNFFFLRNNSNPAAPWEVPAVRRVARAAGKLTPGGLDRRLKRRDQARVEAALGPAIGESNQITEQLTGLNLRGLGYL